MGDIINLNQYRKKRERDHKGRQAIANRAKYGRVKAERQSSIQQREKEENELDQKKCELVPLSFAKPNRAHTEADDDTRPV